MYIYIYNHTYSHCIMVPIGSTCVDHRLVLSDDLKMMIMIIKVIMTIIMNTIILIIPASMYFTYGE
jgi:hypothetical protein